VLSAVRTRDFHPLNGDESHYVRARGALVNGQNCTETRWRVAPEHGSRFIPVERRQEKAGKGGSG